jgi:hypothetical protein
MKLTTAMVAMALWVLACVAFCTAGDAVWLAYEPAPVELKGKLVVVAKYGPPNWGETPDEDMKLQVPILRLNVPVSVQGDPKSETNSETFRDLREIQLAGLGDYEDYRNCDVVVRGTLSRGLTAWEFTKVVMTVTSIRSGQ